MKTQMKEKRQRAILMLSAMMTLLTTNVMVVNASYGQNAANYILDQAFWIVLVIFVILCAIMASKRNFTGALVAGIVGGIVLFIIKNPMKLAEIGESIMKVVMP